MDGAHKIAADLFQALNDTGFTVPAQGSVYWNGEAMSGTDSEDLDDTPSRWRTRPPPSPPLRRTWPGC